MKVKKFLVSAVLLVGTLTATAQNDVGKNNFPANKGDITLAATVGYNSYASISALPGNLTHYEASAPSTNWMDKKLMLGVEGGWFFVDLWKFDFGGGLNFSNNPGYAAVPGTADPNASVEENMGEIPSYRAVADAYTFTYNVYVGCDRYFKIKNVPNLALYSGVRVGFAYGVNEQKYDEYVSMGKSIAETWNLRVGITCGVDYYIFPAMFVGFSIDPFNYTYNMAAYKPQEGLATLRANGHNYSVLGAPTLKVGFKF